MSRFSAEIGRYRFLALSKYDQPKKNLVRERQKQRRMSYAISRPRDASSLLESNRLRILRPFSGRRFQSFRSYRPFPSPPLLSPLPTGTFKPRFQLSQFFHLDSQRDFIVLQSFIPNYSLVIIYLLTHCLFIFDVKNIFLRLNISVERVASRYIHAFMVVASENWQCYHALSSNSERKTKDYITFR